MSASHADEPSSRGVDPAGIVTKPPDWLAPVAGSLGFPVGIVVGVSTMSALDSSGVVAAAAGVLSGTAIVAGAVLAAGLGWTLAASKSTSDN